MPKKGISNNPNGRPKGSLNVTTSTAKKLVTEFVGRNMEDMQELFEQIKQEDPKKAFDVLMGSLEYVIPKLARTDNMNYTLEEKVESLSDEDKKIIQNYKVKLQERFD